MLQTAEHWPGWQDSKPVRPIVGRRPDAEEIQRIREYNWSLGPIATYDTVQIAHLIAEAQRRNDFSSLNGQRCVLVSGRPLDGKTHGVAAAAFADCHRAWAGPPPGHPRSRHIPWAYVEVEAGKGLAGILRSLSNFMGIPVASRPSTTDHMYQLRRLLPELGCTGLIVDDAHGIMGARTDSRTFAGALKALITGLPLTVVVIGVELETSPALTGARGDEVCGRASQIYRCGNWPEPFAGKKPGPWEQLTASLARQLVLPDPQAMKGMNSRRFVTTLAHGSDHRPGIAIDWVKEACDYALQRDTVLSREAMESTHSIIRQRIAEADEAVLHRPSLGRPRKAPAASAEKSGGSR